MVAKGTKAKTTVCKEMRFSLLPEHHTLLGEIRPESRFTKLRELVHEYIDPHTKTFKAKLADKVLDERVYLYVPKKHAAILGKLDGGVARVEYMARSLKQKAKYKTLWVSPETHARIMAAKPDGESVSSWLKKRIEMSEGLFDLMNPKKSFSLN
jgi:hypothetical protein